MSADEKSDSAAAANNSDSAAASAAAETIIDDALNAADGTRKTARWMLSVLGALPSIGIITVLVRAPGDAGYRPWYLTAGILLAAAGFVLALLMFARVLQPVPLQDSDLQGFDLHRVPRAVDANIKDLDDQIRRDREAIVERQEQARGLVAAAAAAAVIASDADKQATLAEQLADSDKAEADDKRIARRVRADARLKQAAAAAAQAQVDQQTAFNDFQQQQVDRRGEVRHAAFLIRSGEKVGDRFFLASLLLIPALGLIAGGLILLALAPKPKSETTETAAPPPTLVSLTLNKAGQKALACPDKTLRGLRVGGEDTAPLVITFPTSTCEARSVVFNAAKPAPYGTVTKVEQSGSIK